MKPWGSQAPGGAFLLVVVLVLAVAVRRRGRTRLSGIKPCWVGLGCPTHSMRRAAHSFGRPRVTPGCHDGRIKLRAGAAGPSGAFGRRCGGRSGRGRPRVGSPRLAVAEHGPEPH